MNLVDVVVAHITSIHHEMGLSSGGEDFLYPIIQQNQHILSSRFKYGDPGGRIREYLASGRPGWSETQSDSSDTVHCENLGCAGTGHFGLLGNCGPHPFTSVLVHEASTI